MQRDGIHPNEQGARRIAEIVAEAVSSIKEL
jgi:lysophospholipase L1-like esterase